MADAIASKQAAAGTVSKRKRMMLASAFGSRLDKRNGPANFGHPEVIARRNCATRRAGTSLRDGIAVEWPLANLPGTTDNRETGTPDWWARPHGLPGRQWQTTFSESGGFSGARSEWLAIRRRPVLQLPDQAKCEDAEKLPRGLCRGRGSVLNTRNYSPASDSQLGPTHFY